MADNDIPVEEAPAADSKNAVADHITIERGAVASAQCDRLDMNEAGAGIITVERRAEMSQSGAGIVTAGEEVELFQSGAAVAVTQRADVKQGFVGILVASEASFEQESRVMISAQNAVIFGAVCGAVFAVVVAIGDYFVRGMFQD